MKVICLYGRPAAGKTTQAEKIAADFGYQQFGMGDRLRAEIARGSELGKKIKESVDKGVLITDDIMEEVIRQSDFQKNDRGIIFDGFPRMVSQAKMLEKIITDFGWEFVGFFNLKVSVETAKKRITARGETTGRADDKNQEAVKNRLDAFAEESVPLTAYYKERGGLVEIDGEKSIEEVYAEIKKHV